MPPSLPYYAPRGEMDQTAPVAPLCRRPSSRFDLTRVVARRALMAVVRHTACDTPGRPLGGDDRPRAADRRRRDVDAFIVGPMIHGHASVVLQCKDGLLSDGVSGLRDVTDEDLLARIVARDDRAIAALYDRYGGLVFALAYRVLSDRGAAEDVAQDVFLSIWRRASSFQTGRGSVRTWLLSIVHHRAIDRLRGTSGRNRTDAPLDIVDRVAAADDPWREVDTNLQRDLLKQSLSTLPEAQRETIELAYFGGYTQSEIAALMAVPLGTVKGRMRIGLQKLRGLLLGAGID